MKRLTTITAFALAVLAGPFVHAQKVDTNDRTFLTFSNAVELPGVTLEAGTYEFRVADLDSHNVVQVFRKDNREVVGQWTFVPAERPQASDDTVVMFKETREGATPAVQYWYYPGEKIGKEFVYPKDQAQRIASRTGQTVKSEGGAVAAQTANNDNAASNRPADAAVSNQSAEASANPRAAVGERADASPAPAAAAREGEPVAPAAPRPVGTSGSNAEPPAATDAGAPAPAIARANDSPQAAAASPRAAQDEQPQQVAQNELPRTASPLPLIGLIGALALFGAVALRALRYTV